MLYVKAYDEKLQQCIIRDTSDDTEEKVGVSEVRKVVSRGIQIPGVYPDRITPVTEEQAVKQKLTLLKLIIGNDAIEINTSEEYVKIDCSGIDKLILPDISYKYRLGGNDKVSVELASDWEIISKCFFRDSYFVEIIIPDGVKHIGAYAFLNCSSLKSIVIPDSVTSIEAEAFADCSSLENIVIPDSVTSIRFFAFENCSSLENIVIPDSVTSIGDGVFQGCSRLKSITIPDSVTSIGAYAFLNTSWLRRMRKISPLVIVNNILVDGKTASGNVKVPNNVIDITAYAFKGSGITCITIPYGITSIKSGTFFGCESLCDIDIPNSVTSINWDAFWGCSSLENITIPDSVKSIGDNAFARCTHNLVIRCSKGSYAEKYAIKHNLKYKIVG